MVKTAVGEKKIYADSAKFSSLQEYILAYRQFADKFEPLI
jgi:hypothetical protein